MANPIPSLYEHIHTHISNSIIWLLSHVSADLALIVVQHKRCLNHVSKSTHLHITKHSLEKRKDTLEKRKDKISVKFADGEMKYAQ